VCSWQKWLQFGFRFGFAKTLSFLVWFRFRFFWFGFCNVCCLMCMHSTGYLPVSCFMINHEEFFTPYSGISKALSANLVCLVYESISCVNHISASFRNLPVPPHKQQKWGFGITLMYTSYSTETCFSWMDLFCLVEDMPWKCHFLVGILGSYGFGAIDPSYQHLILRVPALCRPIYTELMWSPKSC